MMELLSPAGSFEALQAAVCAGADAVYLGATAFSARASAANFDDGTLPRAVSYAHMSGVKVLVTVNTLIFPREMDDAVALVQRLRDAGADGLIVQDLGLAEALRARLGPDVPLHASTQATVHNLPGIQEMARRGFRRVVLARELSLKELAPLCRESPVELEVFAHGALCVSCSGACLMSSMIGGRSGNPRRSPQPTRQPN
ncbi:MAG: peptidase U32 family protein, partial [Christensenellaceae bacterium]